MTLWDEFVSNEGAHLAQVIDSLPIIIATRLKVTSYNGLSLATRFTSTFLFNPSIPESKALDDWLCQNQDNIQNILKNKVTLPAKISSLATAPITFASIDSISSINKNTTFWVKATTTIKEKNQKMCCMCCSTCWNEIHADFEQKFKCHFCVQERLAKPRCRFIVELSDKTGSTTVTIFEENAEKLFDTTTILIMESSSEEGYANMDILQTTKTSKEYHFQLKSSKKQEDKFIVLNIKDQLEHKDNQTSHEIPIPDIKNQLEYKDN